jgi:putative oxidoreductase
MNRWTEKVAPLALGYLHVAVGFEFLVKGLPKIQNPAAADRLASGIHFPLFMGWFPTLLEPIGGALLILGLGTRWLGAYFMAEMFVTGVISKIMIRGVPFVMPNNQPGSGFELDALVFGGAFVLVVFGAGPFALDHVIGKLFRRGTSRSTPAVSALGASPG